MIRFLLSFAAALVLLACSDEKPRNTPEQIITPLSFTTPPEGDLYDNLHHPVASYVLARGAGPSRLSPDGKTIAMRLSLTGTRQLYVMPTDGSSEPSQITNGSGITFFEFSPTGAILFGADNNGDEREAYWLTAPDGKGGWSEPRIVLPATDQGFRSFGDFTADGQTIVYSSTERNGLDYDIYTADLASGESALIFEGQYGNFVEAVAPDGKAAIVSESIGEDSDRIFVLDLKTGKRRVLSDPAPRANHTDAGVHFTDDGQAVIYATNKGREFTAVLARSLSGTKDALLPGLGASLLVNASSDYDQIKVCERGLLFTANELGFSNLSYLGESRTHSFEDLPGGVYDFDCAGDTALIHVSAPNIPGDLYRADLKSGALTRVYASAYDGLSRAALIMPKPVTLSARDGLDIHGLLYLPKGVQKPPVVFDVHGGPTAQARPRWNGSVQYLLSRGIAVFQPNVRGSTGYGRTYAALDDRKKRLDSVRDLVDMLAWLRADGQVDTSRAAVRGGSYGGYMVNAVLADYPDAFDAGVALFGVGDWVTALEVASPALKDSDRIEYGDISDPAWRDFYAQISPIAKAGQIRVPVLYSHGAMDPRIDVAETDIMVRALRENGVRADYILFPDEGHGWRKLSNRLFYAKAEADFLMDVLGQ